MIVYVTAGADDMARARCVCSAFPPDRSCDLSEGHKMDSTFQTSRAFARSIARSSMSVILAIRSETRSRCSQAIRISRGATSDATPELASLVRFDDQEFPLGRTACVA